MIRILVVDDISTTREFVVEILNSHPDLQVVGTACNGEEAIEKALSLRPDIIAMDIQMPKLGGIETTRRIMETHPLPIVVVSGTVDPANRSKIFDIMEAGALSVLSRPFGIGHPEHTSSVKVLLETVIALSQVKVVRRWKKSEKVNVSKPGFYSPRALDLVQIVAIGASTGGPAALQSIFELLPNNFSLPILVVQHMCPGFMEAFMEWLSACCKVPVHLAIQGEIPLPGHIYFAPDSYHLGISQTGKMLLSKNEPINGLRPSATYLFQTVAEVFGKNAIGILLTGMGRDGVDGLKMMNEKGANTIAQDKESSVVHGMPGEAIQAGAVKHILAPIEIANILVTLDRSQRGDKYGQ